MVVYSSSFNSELWMLHVTESSLPDTINNKPIGKIPADSLVKAHHEMIKHIDMLKSNNIASDGILMHGSATDAIMKEIEDLNADMLIIGEKHHSAMYKALMGGSTSTKILKQINIPLLIIPIANSD